MTKKKKTIQNYQKKKIHVDPLYQSYWFSKFINKFIKNGKKANMEKIIYQSLNKIKIRFQRLPMKLLFFSLIRLKPMFYLVSKRFGKEFKKIPMLLEPRRQYIIALTWLVNHIKTESSLNFENKFIQVFTNLLKKKKTALTKYRNTYFFDIQAARINRKFRWK